MKQFSILISKEYPFAQGVGQKETQNLTSNGGPLVVSCNNGGTVNVDGFVNSAGGAAISTTERDANRVMPG